MACLEYWEDLAKIVRDVIFAHDRDRKQNLKHPAAAGTWAS